MEAFRDFSCFVVAIEAWWGFPVIDGDFSGSMVAIEAWWGFPMIDGDFSEFDGISIRVKGLFTLIRTLMDNGLLFSLSGLPFESGGI
jgi:hypothetical protein